MSNTIPLPNSDGSIWVDGAVKSGYTFQTMKDYAAAVTAADNAALREQVQALQSEVIRATNFELDAGRVMRHEPMLNGFEDLWAIEAEFDALRERVKVLEDALTKIDAIRNDIIGRQKIGWSSHVYPLVAALDEAGYPGLDYEAARAALGDKTC